MNESTENPGSSELIGHREADFAKACQAAGLAATPQRRLIYRILAESHDHPDAEAVCRRVRKLLPRVSLATVYRNLKLFAEAGIIAEVATPGAAARFDANRDRHHHLICTVCNRVVDFYSERIDGLRSASELREAAGGFEVVDLKVNVYGLCASCRAAGATPS